MLSYFVPFLYLSVLMLLLWQAFKIMSKGIVAAQSPGAELKEKNLPEDRTGLLTVHPELLNQEGSITDEELLTVRFSTDSDPPSKSD